MKNIQGLIRKAIQQYDMIEENDRIAVGLSGGKDSLTLLKNLKELQRYYPKKYELCAISIDMYNGKTDYTKIKEFCNQLDVELKIVPTQLYELLFEVRKEQNPCSLCAKIRRGTLVNVAKENGFNKVALGHHANDLIETFFLSMFFEGRLSTFAPVTYLSKSQITTIRPMIFVWEKDVISYSKDLPVLYNPCPADKHTQRESIKQMLQEMEKQIPKLDKNLLNAIISPERYHLFNDFINKDN